VRPLRPRQTALLTARTPVNEGESDATRRAATRGSGSGLSLPRRVARKEANPAWRRMASTTGVDVSLRLLLLRRSAETHHRVFPRLRLRSPRPPRLALHLHRPLLLAPASSAPWPASRALRLSPPRLRLRRRRHGWLGKQRPPRASLLRRRRRRPRCRMRRRQSRG